MRSGTLPTVRKTDSVRLPGRPRVGGPPPVDDDLPLGLGRGHVAFLTLTAIGLSRLLRRPQLPERHTAYLDIDSELLAARAGMRRHAVPRSEMVRAHGAISRYLCLWMPSPDVTFAGRAVFDATTSDAFPAELARGVEPHRPYGRRLAWAADRSELGRGLLLDRVHYTHRSGCVDDPWMREQVVADHTLGTHLAGTAYLGVRVLVPLLPGASMHELPAGGSHPLGECHVCATRSAW